MPWKESWWKVTERHTPDEKKKLLGFIGLCRRAQKTVCGTSLVCEALGGRKKPALVVYCEGASAPTKKRIESKCAFYGTPALLLPLSPDELGQAVGKGGPIAAVAVTDAQFAAAILEKAAGLSPAPQNI